MTHASYKKILPQLENNPAKKAKFLKHSAPKKRSCGRINSRCSRCGKMGGSVTKSYGLNLCRQCFREIATKIGFKQYS